MAKPHKKSLAARFLPARFNKAAKVVPHVRLAGAIGSVPGFKPSLSLASTGKTLEKAFAIKGSAAVAVSINSPGGSPAQAALIHNRIRALAEENDVPVFTFCEDVAASGGYMLACAGDEIYGQRFSIIGSIGVISAGFGFVEAIEKLGVERRVHTAGKNKSILDPFQPENKQDIDRLKQIQLDIHGGFIDLVRTRRKDKLDETDTELFTGAFWTAPEALERGLIDATGDMHKVLQDKFGDDLLIKPIAPPSGFGLKRLLSSQNGQDGRAFDINVSGGIADELIQALEKRALWQRFGL